MSAPDQTTGPASQATQQKYQLMHPVDLVHLAKYTMGDTALEAEILGLFARQSRLYFGQLEKAASAKEWHAAAHTLKGCARSVGAFHIADLAAEAEKIAEAGFETGFETKFQDEKLDLLGKMRQELLEAIDYIDSLLDNRAV